MKNMKNMKTTLKSPKNTLARIYEIKNSKI